MLHKFVQNWLYFTFLNLRLFNFAEFCEVALNMGKKKSLLWLSEMIYYQWHSLTNYFGNCFKRLSLPWNQGNYEVSITSGSWNFITPISSDYFKLATKVKIDTIFNKICWFLSKYYCVCCIKNNFSDRDLTLGAWIK